MRRMAIFMFWDDKGIVYDYVMYLLRDLLSNIQELHIVANGYLREESRDKFLGLTPYVYERPNTGFDAAAWREVMVEHCGFEHLREFDEVIILNDSFFGPLYPFREIFAEMDARKTDFWGFTVHGECNSQKKMCPYGYRPRYLQTYFLAFRSRLLADSRFERYWTDLPEFNSFTELVELHGSVLTQKFVDWGFAYSVYADTEDLESADRRKNMSHHMFNSYEMVARRKLPLIKRKTFIMDKSEHLRYGSAGSLPRTMRYIREHTNYDEGLIWQYILQKYNLDDLHEHLNLYYALPLVEQEKSEQLPGRTAILAHLYYDDLFGYYMSMLEDTPAEIDLIITTNTEGKREKLEREYLSSSTHNWQVITVKERGREWSARLIACRDLLEPYEYLCLLHDKKSSAKEYSTIGMSFGRLLFENILASKGYVRNVLKKFAAEPYLGIMVPPNVYFGTYFRDWVNFWSKDYMLANELMCRLGLQPNINHEKMPVALGSDFWCRKEALAPLFAFDWKYEDFPAEPMLGDGQISHAMERIAPYIAQAQGFYTATIMTDKTAETEVANFRYMMHESLVAEVARGGVDYATFARLNISMARR